MIDDKLARRPPSVAGAGLATLAMLRRHGDTARVAGSAQPSGIAFGPTASGKLYLSVYAHRGANPRKSQWAIPPTDEFGCFSRSDAEGWLDLDGHLWGALDPTGPTLGTRGERLAKFPRTVPPTPWHGYPVSASSGRASETPPDELVERLRDDGRLTRTLARKLQTRRA